MRIERLRELRVAVVHQEFELQPFVFDELLEGCVLVNPASASPRMNDRRQFGECRTHILGEGQDRQNNLAFLLLRSKWLATIGRR